jgi:hypothetical protein
MESIRDGDKLITDPHEISKVITKVFRDWFFRGEKEAWRDHNVSDAIIGDDKDRFMEVALSLEVPPEVAEKIWESCRIKPIQQAAKCDMEGLDDYTPSYNEFLDFIETTNPRSAGGYNGLNYNLLRNLPSELKKRISEILVEAWTTRTPLEGWGDRWLVPIPKIKDPTLKDLRPIMLVDVLRKVWVGLLLNRVRIAWDKWGLMNETQHGFMTGKGTHTAIPHLIRLMETARHSGAP